jgi:ubiquinone/menaquinone biosynthesis C-methylase UbiE
MKKTIGTEESIRRWNQFADTYASQHFENGDLHKEVFLNSILFELMGELKGKRVLDAGCGEGYLSRLMAKRGAQVTAVDYAPRMLEIARERTPDGLDIYYHNGNLEQLDLFNDGIFGLVVSNMVFQDLGDFESALKEIYRVIVPGGSFVMSILHPCFVTPKSGWEKNDRGEKIHWNVDRYFYEGAYEQKLGNEEKMILFHRTLTTYINTMVKTGFAIESIVEPKPSEEILKKHPSFEEDFRCADFILFKLRKAGEDRQISWFSPIVP